LFSVFCSSILYSSSKNKEKEIRKSYAYKLTAKRDKLAEFLYPAIEKQILQDSVVIKYIKQSITKPEVERKLLDYVKTKFSNNYWNKYEVQAYICRDGSKLQIQPANVIVGCENYFSSIITNMGFKTISQNLYYIDESYDLYTYISKLDLPQPDPKKQKVSIYFEFYSKMTTSNLGYPELLIDNEFYQRIDLTEYSYAIYHQGDLAKSVGDYQYQLTAPTQNSLLQNSYMFFDKDNYNHLYLKTSPYTSILISKKKPTLINILSYFSYIFILSALLLLLFKILTNKNLKLLLSSTIKQRLQFWTITIILLSSITIGCVMLFYLFDLDMRKNQNILRDKAHSVLVELEQRYSYLDNIHKIPTQELSQNLSSYSNIFFTDINLFDKNGDLIATSRPQLYEAELISKKMNPLAYYSLKENQQIIEIKDEKIGTYTFQSAYVPLRDTKNKTLGYINLPYFARQSEFRADLSTLLVAFINIYVILTVIAVLIALIVSSYITRPLQLIKNKISQINYFKKPEKILWQGADELADLIKQYNNMVDDLANSAELLARSERESAWRIMAQQVAHEIKNPLTPMKLNVQHLQRSWQDNKENWDLRLDRFTQTMVTQIDALSTIAGEFSDFAKMPNSNLEIIDLNQCVNESVLLFTDSTNLTINIKSENKENWIKSDKQQVTRILNNLFRNSIQALNTEKQGIITISIYKDNKFKILEFSDNGIGIKKELHSKIFTPFFTTKTTGTGLGLAMVKNITESFGGTIDFISTEGIGTTFILSFPSSDQPNK
jgi:nitrogen fixation/metabolism regulation signal transduction histidine kinase